MNNQFSKIKRRSIREHYILLLEQYSALSQQIAYTIDKSQEVLLKKKLSDLELEISKLESDLNKVGSYKDQNGLPDSSRKITLEPTRNLSLPKLPRLGTGNHWAVLVGINQYKDKTYRQLNACVKDVESINQQLLARDYSPECINLFTDNTTLLPKRNIIIEAVKSLAAKTKPNDLLLFYYSGHGDEATGQSYLVAQDASYDNLGRTAVPVAKIVEIMRQARARAKVLILDACHSGAKLGSKGAKPMSAEFINRVFKQAEGLVILSSCKQAEFSYEVRQQGVFTRFLLEGLSGQADRDQKGFVTVQDIHRHVSDGVLRWAKRNKLEQTPTLQCEVVGDIILAAYR